MASKKRSSKKISKKSAKSGSKMEIATSLYQDMTKRGLPRKAIIDAFMSDAKLTKAGASTYYQLIGKKLNA